MRRRVIGFGGAVVIVAVAIVALVREKPATASSNGDHPVNPPFNPPAAPVSSTISPDFDATRSASTVPDRSKQSAPTEETTTTASTVSTTSQNGSFVDRGAPIRGLVMKSDEPSRSPGASTTMTKESIHNAIKAVTPKIKDCYEKALEQNPDLGGTVKVNFTLKASDDGKGEVTEGEIADSETQSPFFEACVLKEVAGAEFDAPEGGGVVKVTYPFHFANDNNDTPASK